MSLARYLSKLGAMLGSDGKVPTDALGVGAVLQVVGLTHSTLTALGSTVDGVWRDYGSATITPKFSSSKILVLHTAEFDLSTGNYPCIKTRMHKYIGGVSQGILYTKDIRGYLGNSQLHHVESDPQIVLDSPNSNQAVTYYFQATNSSGSSTSGSYAGVMNQYQPSKTLLIEIAA